MDFGHKLRQFRSTRKLTLEKMAEKLECSVSYLSMIERGERSFDPRLFAVLLEAFDVTAESVLGFTTAYSAEEQALIEKYRKVPESDRKDIQKITDKYAKQADFKNNSDT